MRSKRLGLSRVERIEDRAQRAKALYFSLVVSLACVIMSCFCLLGTTYALFTSTASTDSNTLGTGFLSVSLHNVEVTNNTADIDTSELIYDNPMFGQETQNISKTESISKYVYVRNNSSVDAEYSLSFALGSSGANPSNEDESISSIADFVDVSYCKVELNDSTKEMNPDNYIYLGKLSDLLINKTDDDANNNKRKIMGVLSKLRTNEDDIVDINDISYPIGQLYKITFSLNDASGETTTGLTELPINIVLSSTQRDLDIHQISVVADAYDIEELDGTPLKAGLSCTNFIGAGDYYAGDYSDNTINISIKNKVRLEILEELGESETYDFMPVEYSIDEGEYFDINDNANTYSIISIDNIDKDIVIKVKYELIAKDHK